MREIKFRAWDKKKKCWINPYKMALKEEKYKILMYCDMEGFGIMEDGSLIIADECGCYRYLDNDRFEVNFYIGITDKNNKKIFVNDLVKYNNKIFAVKWDNAALQYYFENLENELDNFVCDFYMVTGKDLEIIGNIYENNLVKE